MSLLTPASEGEIAEIVKEAAADRRPLDIVGGGTRDGLGRPREADDQLSLAGLTGVTLYEPAELVLSARAGTPISEIAALVGQCGQMLPFEPMDHRSLYGTAGAPSIGAIAACNISGPRRLSTGAARDALIGLRFVNGRGEALGAGGRVMKNVTGLDLVKLSAGAHGTLGVLTEVTFKLLPVPEKAATLVFAGLDDETALRLVAAAVGSPHEVSAAAHLPAGASPEGPRTYIRIEGLDHSVDARLAAFRRELAEFGAPETLGPDETDRVWTAIRDAKPIAEPADREIWRIGIAASKAGEVVPALGGAEGLAYFYDWAGGSIWLAAERDIAAPLRAEATRLGGYATVIRASAERRAEVPVFQPPSEPVMALTRGVKQAFDPQMILNRGRMYQGL